MSNLCNHSNELKSCKIASACHNLFTTRAIALDRVQLRLEMEDFGKSGKPDSKFDIAGNNDATIPYNECGCGATFSPYLSP